MGIFKHVTVYYFQCSTLGTSEIIMHILAGHQWEGHASGLQIVSL